MSITSLAIIEKEIKGYDASSMIANSLGKPITDPMVMKFINGALMYIQSKIGQKGDVSGCTKQSIVDSLINAATVKLPVDNKHYACLIPYKDICTFQPEWRGYLAKVKEADPSAEVSAVLVFKGDKFSYSRKNEQITYEHIINDPFEDNPKNITGAYCYIKTDSWSDIEVMSRDELDAVRATSKAGYAFMWEAWTNEQYRKTIIRRGLKRKFTTAVAGLDALDNRHYNTIAEKESPKLKALAPLPSENAQKIEIVKEEQPKQAITAEVINDTKELAQAAEKAKEAFHAEGVTSTPEATPAAKKADKSSSSGLAPEPVQKVLKGLLAAYYPPTGKGPHKFHIQGEYCQTFDTELAETLINHREKEDEVELVCHIETSTNKSTGKVYENNVIDSVSVQS
jgi:recombinational DNA repair protein RecT